MNNYNKIEKNKDKEKKITIDYMPYFLVIPQEIYTNKKLTPTDGYVFASIYYFTNLSNKKCTAGNETLATLISRSISTINKSLEKLENANLIARIYYKKGRWHRKEIKILIDIGVPNTYNTLHSRIL